MIETALNVAMGAVFAYLITLATYTCYLAAMLLKRHKEELSRPAKFLGYPILCTGIFCDVLLNWFVATPIFLDPPREFTFTARLIRTKASGNGYQKRLANFFCSKLLDQFDPSGPHCGG